MMEFSDLIDIVLLEFIGITIDVFREKTLC